MSDELAQRLASLQKYWECKAEECERWEKHYEASDPVTSQQSKASKEVYRTCIRELCVSLANEKEQSPGPASTGK